MSAAKIAFFLLPAIPHTSFERAVLRKSFP